METDRTESVREARAVEEQAEQYLNSMQGMVEAGQQTVGELQQMVLPGYGWLG